jgi:hypothetical protein
MKDLLSAILVFLLTAIVLIICFIVCYTLRIVGGLLRVINDIIVFPFDFLVKFSAATKKYLSK